MKISSISVGKMRIQPHFQKKLPSQASYASQTNFTGNNEKNQGPKLSKTLPFALMALGAGVGLGAGLIFSTRKNKLQLENMQKAQNAIAELLEKGKKSEALNEKTANQIAQLVEQTKKVDNNDTGKLWAAILALAGISGYNSSHLSNNDKDEVVSKLSKGQSDVQVAAYGASAQVGKMNNFQTNPTVNKYSADYYGLSLLTQNNVMNRNAGKYKAAIETIQNIAHEKLTSTQGLAPIEKEHPTLWSVTSEFAPIKEGGLGSVPVEVRNNVVKLGVEIPTFIPMYLNNGTSALSKSGDSATYFYKGKNFNLDKIAEFKMDTFKNGKPESLPVELYLHEEGEDYPKKQLVFIKCDKYFDGTIYESSSKSEEPEKFAIMSKAVYEFAKLKMDGQSAIKDLYIPNNGAIDKVNAPDGMILNDWQASPIAALARYKSTMENAHGELSDKTMKNLRDMRIITLGHNVAYQGSTQNNNDDAQRKASTSNILNTLFDKYTFDIVSNANSGTEKIDPNDHGLQTLSNVLVMDSHNPWGNHTNLLNMGIVLSDYFHPVSQNYANELISPEHPELSNSLQWALTQKAKAGKLVGIINGNDFNNLSVEAKKGQIKSLTALDFETYKKSSSLDDVLTARAHNKANLYQNYILPFTESNVSSQNDIERAKGVSTRLEFVKGSKGTQMPALSYDEIQNTPIMTSGGRLVTQKGIGVLCEAIAKLFKNWEMDFPNKPKPIFYIAGSDGEGGAQRKIIEELKDSKLSNEDNNRVLFAHGFAPMAGMMGGSDFFLMPSLFEPCGLTQGESLALATPVIASAVGGIVDTINRDGKENGILTKPEKSLSSDEFYNAMKKGLDIYFNDKTRYNNMVKDSLAEDYSWIQKGKQGPVFDYLDIIGVKRENLPDVV